ncbi:hypothetical protein [Salipiger thiooxidans]|uniref:hypothetical protein n=1 Tax=Salipiger thiooxidans TaxID=282683 RepID=UPI001CD647D0|nr:hypothetical protein [Salipiger thiooxidans]MCA0849214.1 hypothetical protein [Salipiger thiooxidans]
MLILLEQVQPLKWFTSVKIALPGEAFVAYAFFCVTVESISSMADAFASEFDGRFDRLYIHFDVRDHFLKLDTFIKTAENARKVIDALDETFFDGGLEYELIVLPPEEGTFLSKLALWISGGTTVVFGFLNTDVGSAYVEGLTGRNPAEWAQSFGEDHRARIDAFQVETEMPENYETGSGVIAGPPEASPISTDEACKEAAQIVVAMARGVLEKSPDELQKVGMEVGALPDAVDARADFYAACLEDRDVKRVGFTPEDEFPIPRNSFPERARKPTRKPKDEDPPEWFVSMESIYVTSPNWDKEDQKTRQWKGKDQVRRDCYFVIEDAEFWHKVKQKALHVEVLDNLKVQWAFQNIDGRPKNRRVLRVLEFNGDKLTDPLPPAAVRAIVGQYSEYEASNGPRTLFDQ